MSKPRVRRKAAREKRLRPGEAEYLAQELALEGRFAPCELCGSRACQQHFEEYGVELCMEVELAGW